MNVPKIPYSLKEDLERTGSRKDCHQWRKLARLASSYQANGLEREEPHR